VDPERRAEEKTVKSARGVGSILVGAVVVLFVLGLIYRWLQIRSR
jgi:hypothetical protein